MKILFVKTSSLGDVVHHCPAVSDAARAFPGAQIDWVVEEPFAAVAALHRAVRRVIPVALRRWRRSLWRPAVWAEIGAFRRALRAERYDRVIDAQGLAKSALIARLARGERHGYDAASAREPFAARCYDVRHAVSRALHAVARNRLLSAAALGYVAPQACDYGLVAPRHTPLAELSAAGSDYAVLLTMTSRADKLWAEANWIELARALRARGLAVVLPWGSEAERARCERIARGSEGALVPPRMALGELAALLHVARAAIGVDTGLAHLAAALGVPSVAVYCATDPGLTGLYGDAPLRNLGSIGKPPAVGEVLAALEELR
jgi:heptosyltransferase-1